MTRDIDNVKEGQEVVGRIGLRAKDDALWKKPKKQSKQKTATEKNKQALSPTKEKAISSTKEKAIPPTKKIVSKSKEKKKSAFNSTIKRFQATK